jgi:hypothetical protein
MRAGGLVAVALAILASAPVLAKQPPPLPPPVPRAPPTNCETPAHHQFDFWIGEWNVVHTTQPNTMVGGSTVSRAYSGCGIHEDWRPFTMEFAGSISSYDPREKVWRQTWVDSFNAHVQLTGGFKDGAMVLSGPWPGLKDGKTGLMRVTWTPGREGPRQRGEYSMDGGATWSPAFDYTYYRREAH